MVRVCVCVCVCECVCVCDAWARPFLTCAVFLRSSFLSLTSSSCSSPMAAKSGTPFSSVSACKTNTPTVRSRNCACVRCVRVCMRVRVRCVCVCA